MPWKTVKIGEGESAIDSIAIDKTSGNPIFIHEEGDEVPVQADVLFGKINKMVESEKKLKTEHKAATAQLEEMKANLEKFQDIDPDQYRDMSEKLKNIKDKTLMEAGEVKKLKDLEREAVTTEWQKKYDKEVNRLTEEHTKTQGLLDKANSALRKATVSNFFSHSPTIVGDGRKVGLVPSYMEDIFGKHFNASPDEEGNLKIIGYWPNGEPIRSSQKTGEIADPEDALWQLIQSDPNKDSILLGDNQSGSGHGERGESRQNATGEKPTTLVGMSMDAKLAVITKWGQEYYDELVLKDSRAQRVQLQEQMRHPQKSPLTP